MAVVELFMSSGQWVGGTNALNEMNRVNMELGNMPTSFNCPACISELLRLTFNNYNNGKA